MKKLITIITLTTAMAASALPTMADNIIAIEYSKDASRIEDLKNEAIIEKKTSLSIRDEETGAVKMETINVNKQEINGDGKATISTETNKKLENVKTKVFLGIDVGVDIPRGSEGVDFSTEHKSSTEIKDCDIGKVYSYVYYYGKPIIIPNLENYPNLKDYQDLKDYPNLLKDYPNLKNYLD